MNRNLKVIIVDGILLLVVLIAIILFVIFKPNYDTGAKDVYEVNGGKVFVKNDVVLPLGSKLPKMDDLVKYNKSEGKIELYFEDVLVTSETLDKIGVYKAIIKVDGEEYESLITVEDKDAPTLEVKDVTIKTRDKYSVKDFVSSCNDNSGEECILEFATKEMEDYKESGTYEIDIIAKDISGNEAKAQAKLIIDSGSSTAVSGNSNETTKYGVKILTTNVNGETKIEYDRSGYNATTEDLLEEATKLLTSNKKQLNDMLRYTNEYRSEAGVANLELDTELSKAAMVRALEMAYSKNMTNTRPNGSSWETVLGELNISVKNKSENLAAMQYSAKIATDWWRSSNTHYKNMINKNYKKMGAGYVYIPVDHKYYWVQIFSD